MPEEEKEQPQVEINPTLEKPKRNWKTIALVVILLALACVLVGVGIWFVVNTPSKETTKPKNTSTTTTPDKDKAQEPRTKFSYQDDSNIWVYDVTSKKKMQITNDGDGEVIFNKGPSFFDNDSLTYLKCTNNSCQLWSADISDSEFTTKEIYNFDVSVNAYDVDERLKTLVYFEAIYYESPARLHIVNLSNQKDTVIYEKKAFGRGATNYDALYIRISPDGSKVLLVDTFGGQELKIYGSEPEIKLAASLSPENPIVVWDISGKKITTLSEGTLPTWSKDSNSFIYRVLDKGVFIYDIEEQESELLTEEDDWSSLAISPNGENIAYNKGFQASEIGPVKNSSIYLFDFETAKSTLLGESLVDPQWVNDSYLVSYKLRKCQPSDNCIIDDIYKYEDLLVVTNVQDKSSVEINTNGFTTIGR